MNNTVEYRTPKGKIVTIEVHPPSSGHASGGLNRFTADLDYVVRARNAQNREVFEGHVSSLLANEFQKSYKLSIPEFLIHHAKVILDGMPEQSFD